MQIRIALPVMLLLLIVGGCGEGVKKNLEKVQVTMVSEGPLYNGPNTATGIWKPDILGAGKVKSARFTAVRIIAADSSMDGLMENMVLQMAAPETEMKKIAFIKGAATGKQISLQVAEEQKDLKDFFKGQEITFVTDYDFLPEELNDNLQFTLEFDVELITD
jgi:hypothetical protein